jgi:HD-GYP domain-containing protein (c-di-GMP phosphodiesterase class II)
LEAGVIKKISVQNLSEGMYLHGLCGSWTQHPFWRTKFVVKDAKDIGLIIDCGITEVWIDAGKGLDLPAAQPEPPQPAAPRPVVSEEPRVQAEVPKTASMHDELQRATKICASAGQAVTAMFEDVRMGKAISGEAAGALVQEISSSVMRNPGALISLARLKTADDYTYMHSVAVCALMVALAGQLGLDEMQTREAGMAGLLHDLGKALMPMDVLNKPGKLSDAEFRIIKGHPEAGHKLLVEAGNAGEAVLDVCLHHHEKVDGSGYPHGLKDRQISGFAKMGAVCDVYDAITSNRPYKAGWDPAESIRKMTEWRDGHFDKRIFEAFVKSIGIYPVGSLVRLASGRLGVVTEQSHRSLLKPTVKAFFSTKSKAYCEPELIHLARAGTVEKIVGIEDAASWDIQDLNEYWMA